jgi:hypothetical protein
VQLKCLAQPNPAQQAVMPGDSVVQSCAPRLQKKARLVGAALNPHQRRRVEETREAGRKGLKQSRYVGEIMDLPRLRVKYFLCIAPYFFAPVYVKRRLPYK